MSFSPEPAGAGVEKLRRFVWAEMAMKTWSEHEKMTVTCSDILIKTSVYQKDKMETGMSSLKKTSIVDIWFKDKTNSSILENVERLVEPEI